jgi:large subunit ribosomal protein L17
VTSQAKAKAIKGLVDKLISKSREGNEASKNVILSKIPQQEVRQKLLEEIAPRYSKRTSGFTEIIKLGKRLGDGAMMVRMSLVEGDKVKE